MSELPVVFVAFDGVQSIDVAGPHEVFAGAARDLVPSARAAASRCRRVAVVCTGAFIAAAAGLLDGRRVTTHWAAAAELQAEYPALEVDPDPPYLRDGQLW